MSFGLWTPGARQRPAESHLSSSDLPIDVPAGQVGRMHAGTLVGQLGSSTRAEIAGGIAALLQPFPVHIGTDSEAFLCKASQILDKPEVHPRKPFPLQRDGDRGQIFAQLVTDRGPNSIAISWRKAHATLHAVLSGKVAGHDAVANGLADWAASQAHIATGQAEREAYLHYLDCKRAEFLAFLTDVNHLIIDILEADALLRKEKASLPKRLRGITDPKPQPHMLTTSFDCPGLADGARLDLWEPCGSQKVLGADPNFYICPRFQLHLRAFQTLSGPGGKTKALRH